MPNNFTHQGESSLFNGLKKLKKMGMSNNVLYGTLNVCCQGKKFVFLRVSMFSKMKLNQCKTILCPEGTGVKCFVA